VSYSSGGQQLHKLLPTASTVKQDPIDGNSKPVKSTNLCQILNVALWLATLLYEQDFSIQEPHKIRRWSLQVATTSNTTMHAARSLER
jgi:hypothetical protein